MAYKKKAKNLKVGKERSEEQSEIIRFIWILAIIIILVIGVYFFTRLFVTKDLTNDDPDTVIEGAIDYNKTLIGSMLTKPEEEYYVIMYDTEDLNSIYYGALASTYIRNEDALRVYYADLNNELNKEYIAEEVNLEVEDLSEFKVKNLALVKIKKGKIVASYETEEEIAEALKYVEASDQSN